MANYNIDAIFNGNGSLPGTERIRIDSSVGIGVTPTAIFGASGVNGKGLQGDSWTISSLQGTDESYFGNNLYSSAYNVWSNRVNAASGAYYITGGTHIFLRGAAQAAGTITPTESMRITNTGAVGIGTTSPNTKFQVSGSATIGGYNTLYSGTGVNSLNINATNYPILAFYVGTTLAGFVGGYSDHMSIYAPASKYITFEPGDSEKMRITSTGALLVGNTSAPNPGAATTVSGFAINGSGNDAYISHKIDNGPCAYFRRDGSDGVVLAFYKANSSPGTISITATTTTYNTTSDYRLKENIRPLSSGLVRINSLKPSVYNWKSDGSNGEGFLAHELAEVVPIAVTGQKDAVNDDGSINPQGVDLSKVVPILVAAIQELSAKVKSLEAKVQILESK